MQAWSKLVDYYNTHNDDAVIGVEVLRPYVDYTRLLRKIMLNDTYTASQHEKAEMYLKELEYYLEEIIRDVVSYLEAKQAGYA